MAWLICGTVPDAAFPLCEGEWELDGELLRLHSLSELSPEIIPLSVQRGTPALLGAALVTCQTLGIPPPHALLAGDIGDGNGSRKLYRALADDLKKAASASILPPNVCGLTFHYLFPDLDGHNAILAALETFEEKMGSRPLMVADAGFMYVAKMSGYADLYDLFTPDVGEMAFLADEKAPHPFYTRGFLLSEDDDVPVLVARAYKHGNCARHLLVKGKKDFLVAGGTIVGHIESPQSEAMECIGGTGDLVTGIVTGFLAGGADMMTACRMAALTNRVLADFAKPTPATQVAALLPFLPDAVRHVHKLCLNQGCVLPW